MASNLRSEIEQVLEQEVILNRERSNKQSSPSMAANGQSYSSRYARRKSNCVQRPSKLIPTILLLSIFILVIDSSHVHGHTIPAASHWGELIEFDEAAFPAMTTTLLDGTTTTFSMDYDVLDNTGNDPTCGVDFYTAGTDGIADLRIEGERVVSTGNPWTQFEGDYDTTSSGSFRSDVSVSPNNGGSREGDFGYIKWTFTLINGLENSSLASMFATRHTSTNGSSELYEWAQVTVNSVPFTESDIGNYSKTDYNDCSATTYLDTNCDETANPPTTNVVPNNVTMSEFLNGDPSGTHAPGGLITPGWWAVDDFNTTILDGLEATSTNPQAGNGSEDDNQTISGAPTYSGDGGGTPDGDFGLAETTAVNSVTYFLGYSDVAVDTDNNGFTSTNSLPAAGVTFLTLGYQCTATAVELLGTSAYNQSGPVSFRILPLILIALVISFLKLQTDVQIRRVG